MKKNDNLIRENISENDKNSDSSKKTEIKGNIIIDEISNNDIYSTKEDKLSTDNNTNDIDKTNKKYRYTVNVSKKNNLQNIELNNNVKSSRMTEMVQVQINKKFSLDNLAIISYAEEHKSANRPLHKIKKFNKETKFCHCCNLPCEQKGIIEPFSYKESIKNFALCGKGIYLYFLYICFSVFCFFIIIIISSITFNINSKKYFNNVVHICNKNRELKNKCNNLNIFNHKDLNSLFWSYKYSINNIKSYKDLCLDLKGNNYNCNKNIINYSIINLYCMITLFIFNIVSLYIFHYINNKLKRGNLPSDYTLFITNLNDYYKDFINKTNKENYNIDKFILYLKKKLFDLSSENKNYSQTIYSINICYEINEFLKIQKKCEKYKYKIIQIKYNHNQKKKNEELNISKEEKKCYFKKPFPIFGCLCLLKKGESLLELTKKKKEKEEEILNLFESNKKLDKFAGCIFVTFKTVKDKEKYYNIFPHYFIERVFHFIKNIKYYLHCCTDEEKRSNFKKKKQINVFYAHEPEDVIWQNLGCSLSERNIRRLLIYFISFILLSILFFIVYFLTSIQDSLNENKNWKFITINIVSYSIALAIVIVNAIFQLLLEFLTEFEKPKSLSDFYLSCSIKLTIFTFITSSIIPFICNTFKNKEHKDNNLMIKNISNLFIVNAIVLPLPTFMVGYCFKKFRIWLIKKKPENFCKTQRQLNEIYELPDMKISYKYSDVCQTLLMTFFYMPIFPLGAVISAIGLILTYLCQKFYFIHFYKRPEMLNESICKFYLEYFIFNLLIYSIGDYVFTYQIYGKKNWNLFNLILFSILTIIPYSKLILLYLDNKKIIQKDLTPMSKNYFIFCNDYERQNPITKKESLRKCINTLSEKKCISEKVKEIAKKNLEYINIMEIYYRASLRKSLMRSQITFADTKTFLKNKLTKLEYENNTNTNINNNESNINTIKNNLNGNDTKIMIEENKNDTDNENKENNDDNDIINDNTNVKAIIEESDFNKIMRNNNLLMLESYKNPFLFAINECIPLNLQEEENLHFTNDIFPDNKFSQSINKNDINNYNNKYPKFQIENNINKLDEIFEESKEEDLYNISILNNLDNITEDNISITKESKDSRAELENKNYIVSNNINNQFYKRLSFKNGGKGSINDLTDKNSNQRVKFKKDAKEKNHIDLTKSAKFKPKKSLNET